MQLSQMDGTGRVNISSIPFHFSLELTVLLFLLIHGGSIIKCNCFMGNIIRNNILNRFVKCKNHIVYVDILQCFFEGNRSTAFLMWSTFGSLQCHILHLR